MADVKLSALPVVTTIATGDLIPFTSTPGGTPVSKNIAIENLISDTAYAASWDGITGVAPSKNAMYDQMQLQMLKTGSNLAIGSDADGDMYYRASSVLARLAKGVANLKMFMNAGATAPEWATGLSVLSFTRDMSLASGDVSYTGAGFKPSTAIVFSCLPGLVMGCIGIAVGTTEFVIRNVLDTSWEYNDSMLVFCTETAGNNQSAISKSMDADGMTMTWTKAGTPTDIIEGFILYLR